MGRKPCCSKVGMRKGAWTADEDRLLTNYIELNGEGNWRSLPMKAGLLRCGKSCRLRWVNYLRPGIKRGKFNPEEDDLIIRLHTLLGGRWSLIAGRLQGRTDNEIKNHWNTYLLKKLKAAGIEPKAKTYYSTAKRTKGSRVQKKYSNTRQNKERKQRQAEKKTDNLLQRDEKCHDETENCEVVEKIQVYRPKAIRLTKGYYSSSSSQSSFQDSAPKFNFPLSSEEVENKKELEKVEDNAIYEKLRLFDELLNGCEISAECSEQTGCYMLEEVYKEFFQILSEI